MCQRWTFVIRSNSIWTSLTFQAFSETQLWILQSHTDSRRSSARLTPSIARLSYPTYTDSPHWTSLLNSCQAKDIAVLSCGPILRLAASRFQILFTQWAEIAQKPFFCFIIRPSNFGCRFPPLEYSSSPFSTERKALASKRFDGWHAKAW